MKSYTIPLSLVGAALVAVGILGHLLGAGGEVLPWVNIGLGVVAIAVAAILDKELFRYYGRWLNALWGSIMVLGIVVMVNFLSNRYHDRLDMTEGKLHSLADLTVSTLENLSMEVQVLAFMEMGENANPQSLHNNDVLESLLKQYTIYSDRFSYEFIDPDKEPERTADYGVQQYNTLIVVGNGKQQKITELAEKEITNALLKTVRGRSEKVYLTVGHGEAGLGQNERALQLLQQRLEEIDYNVEDSLFLARQGSVPQDCAVLIIAGPRTPFFASEVDAIREYLADGGAALVLLDPGYESGLNALFDEWGVQVGNDFVIDTSGIGSLFGLDYTTPVALNYGEHPITEKHQGVMSYFQLVRSVSFDPQERAYLKGAELVRTSEAGWGETDLSVLTGKGKRSVELNPGVDTPGPVSLAVAVSAETGGRLAVFGDADFASNLYFSQQGNGDLALNALSWLAADESLISIRPRQAGSNPIALTATDSEWIFWIGVIVWPLLVALVGLLVVSRQGRWSLADLATAGLGIALSLGVVVLLNFIGDTYHWRRDMTKDKLYTLSNDTVELMQSLEAKGRYAAIKVFINEMEGMRFKDILDEYGYLTENISYEILDPQKHTLEVKQYNVRAYGTSIIEVSGAGEVRTERITEQTEEALSNGIKRALEAENYKIYFARGHGEADLSQVDGSGYSILKGRLKEMNYEVAEGLDLEAGVPQDATVVAVLGPMSALSQKEIGALSRHLVMGGGVLLLVDPLAETGLENLLRAYGVEMANDFIVDASGLGGMLLGTDVSVPVVTQYGRHPITEKMPPGVMSFYPLARSLTPIEPLPPDTEVNVLVATDQKSWGETNLGPISGGDTKVALDPEDRPGPVSLAVAVKAPADTSLGDVKAKLVVFGDVDFGRNDNFTQQGNGELLVGSLVWLAEGEGKLSIAARTPGFSPINLIGSAGEVVLWVSVFILPFAVALAGLIMMLRRGYESYDGFIAWLMYTFVGAAVFYLVLAVIGIGQDEVWSGQGYLLLGLINAGLAYGFYERDQRVWVPGLALAIVNVGMAFVAIPTDTIQWFYAALFAVNAVILVVLVWVKQAFSSTVALASGGTES